MAETGFNWAASWTTIDAAIVLTNGGTTDDTSAAIDIDSKAGCLVSVDTDYSNHALSGTGLEIFILRSVDGTDWEDVSDVPWGFEMPFTQNGTNRRVFRVPPSAHKQFKVYQRWSNATASSVATTATRYITATIPVAS